jgi:hypothetical protein
MKLINAAQGQTIIDLAIQEYGCIEAVVLLMVDNDFSATQTFEAGEQIKIRNEVTDLNGINKAIAKQFKAQNKSVNTASPQFVSAENGYVNEGYVNEGYVN